MDALLEGVYEGEMTFAALEAHGDFGIGTFNDLDGEMIAFDGRFHQFRSGGSATRVTPEQRTPFASVTFFQPQLELRLSEPTSQANIERPIRNASSASLFTAVLVHGTFAQVKTRTVGRQVRPFAPLTEAAAHEQVRDFRSVRGTLVSFHTPVFAQEIGVAGFHLHFLTEAADAGGHVLSYVLENGAVQLMSLRKFSLQLPANKAFARASFDDEAAAAKIKDAEGSQPG